MAIFVKCLRKETNFSLNFSNSFSFSFILLLNDSTSDFKISDLSSFSPCMRSNFDLSSNTSKSFVVTIM